MNNFGLEILLSNHNNSQARPGMVFILRPAESHCLVQNKFQEPMNTLDPRVIGDNGLFGLSTASILGSQRYLRSLIES